MFSNIGAIILQGVHHGAQKIHNHWDHIFGACIFSVPVLAHELCCNILTEQASYPWSDEFVTRAMERNPQLKVSCIPLQRAMSHSWNEFQIIIPRISFSSQYSLQFDDVQLDLIHVGGEHAPDSIIIEVVQEHVTFIGDCYYGAPASSGKRSSIFASTKTLMSSLARQKNNLYIDGHMFPLRSSWWLRGLLQMFSSLGK
jgi:glyoxylase-like metal-dependent hydrolase (beta-lactamase superfamily II)